MSFLILNADARQIPMKNNSVQCVVTSPPYWGLRDYGTATWTGGKQEIDWDYYHPPGREHEWIEPPSDGVGAVMKVCDHIEAWNLKRGNNHGFNSGIDVPRGVQSSSVSSSIAYRDVCGKCGAQRVDSQIGLEKTPQEYVEKIVAVFREVKRVLRDDGVCFVNLGDSYCTGTTAGRQLGTLDFGVGTVNARQIQRNGDCGGLKPKDLCMIPARVALALQADGWYLRSDIIWAKPNPMPESVTDRPTKAHEYIFLLSKNERYYYDGEAIREPQLMTRPAGKSHEVVRNEFGVRSENREERFYNPAGRNIRTVWNIATQPYPEAHFATFPEELAERCIKAGTSEKGCCAKCGKARERVTEIKYIKTQETHNGRHCAVPGAQNWAGMIPANKQSTTLGWQSACKCEAPTVPCTVLDPFGGAGTTVLVADKLGRRGIGLELKFDYCRMAERRCYDDAPLLAQL